MQEHIPLIVNAAGGLISGCLASLKLNGNAAGGATGGFIGGVSTFFATDAMGWLHLLSPDLLALSQYLLGGMVGGAIFGVALGWLLKRRASRKSDSELNPSGPPQSGSP